MAVPAGPTSTVEPSCGIPASSIDARVAVSSHSHVAVRPPAMWFSIRARAPMLLLRGRLTVVSRISSGGNMR